MEHILQMSSWYNKLLNTFTSQTLISFITIIYKGN
jgi:hypothetical protein